MRESWIDPVPGPEDTADSVLEHQLRYALQRVPAPAGLAASVSARTMPPRRATLIRLRDKRWQAAIAAMLLLAVWLAGGALWRRQQRRQAAEETTGKFALAMRLTAASLARSGERLQPVAHPSRQGALRLVD